LKRKLIFALALMVVGGMFLALCTSEDAVSAPEEKVTLKLGVLSVEDTLPYFVAVDEGTYAAEGVDVEVVPFASAMERDSALVAGELDGVFNDPIGVALLKEGGTDVVIVSLSLGEKPEEGVFAIIASPNSSISSPADLKGKDIAISSGTIIEYVTDRMLEENGISGEETEKVEVKQIPVRLELLLQGKVEAATLPEPLASLAAAKGSKLIISDASLPSGRSVSQTVLVFREDYAVENPDAIKRFLRANGKAADAINSNPSAYHELFLEKARVPGIIAETYEMPVYPAPQLPDRAEFEEAMGWMASKGLVERAFAYEELVDGSYLP